MLKVLNLHGVGLHDEKTDWQGAWRSAIDDAIPRGRAAHVFPLYDDLFRNKEADLDADAISRAIARLVTSGLVYGVLDLFRRNRGTPTAITQFIRDLPDRLRWTAGMVVQWTDDEKLRADLRAWLAAQIAESDPDVIVAHSLGSLIAYDTLIHDLPVAEGRVLVTLGSQVGNATVRSVFSGRIKYPATLKRWYHLFNPFDDFFTARVRLPGDERFEEIDTPDDAQGFGDHDALAYLLHRNSRYAVWSCLGADKIPASRNAYAAATSTGAERRALLIGINTYGGSLQRLEGCVNDVYEVSATLQESGFRPDDIRVLLDDRATAAAIRERLEWLLVGAKAGDWRFLYFSGHGTQLPGYGLEEVDRLDEILVPVDFDWTPKTAITDNDLFELYSQLDYDTLFMAVFDCCHSGGLTRASPNRVRGIEPPDDIRHRMLQWDSVSGMWTQRPMEPPPDLRAHDDFLRGTSKTSKLGRAVDLRKLDDASFDEVRKELGHYGPYMPLVLQACQEDELSYEYTHGVTAYGAFTFAFTSTLRRLRQQGVAPTYLQLTEQVSKTLANLGYTQRPQIAGPLKWKSAKVVFAEAGREGNRAEIRDLLAGDLETVPDLDQRVLRLIELAEKEPEAFERTSATTVVRAADDRGDLTKTFLERWQLDWKRVETPKTAKQLLALLNRAKKDHVSVRVVGAARSLSEVCNPKDLPALNGLPARGVVAVSLIDLADPIPFEPHPGSEWHHPPRSARWQALNPGKTLVRCGAGRAVRRVLDDLKRNGLSLENHGSGSFQGIVGALATGTHGSGVALPALAGFVRALTIAVPTQGGPARLELILPNSPDRKVFRVEDGTMLTMKEGETEHRVLVRADDDAFDAHTIGLGCLGLVHSVVIEVVEKKLFLDERRWLTRWNKFKSALVETVHDHRHVEVQICPQPGEGTVDDDEAVGPADHLVQVTERDLSESDRQRGTPGAPLIVGRLESARDLIGGRIRAALRDPTKLASGVVCSLTKSAGDKRDYTDYIADVLLVDLKYDGLGAEYAVPLSAAVDAADAVLKIARDHDRSARNVVAAGGAIARLETLWESQPPFTAVVTLRFVGNDRALLALSSVASEPVCVIEVGMLGTPRLERALRGAATLESDSDALRLYRAYDKGRRALFRTIEETLQTLGSNAPHPWRVRPHWGLVNHTHQATAASAWGPAWDTWKRRYDAVNLGGIFDNAYTDQLQISSRPP